MKGALEVIAKVAIGVATGVVMGAPLHIQDVDAIRQLSEGYGVYGGSIALSNKYIFGESKQEALGSAAAMSTGFIVGQLLYQIGKMYQ